MFSFFKALADSPAGLIEVANISLKNKINELPNKSKKIKKFPKKNPKSNFSYNIASKTLQIFRKYKSKS